MNVPAGLGRFQRPTILALGVKRLSDDSKAIVKSGIDKAANELSLYLDKLGYKRTKKWLWTRRNLNSVDFISFSTVGGSYGAPINNSIWIRLECGNRLLDDERDYLHVNGPFRSDSPKLRENKYHHRFNAKSGSTYERCMTDLIRYIDEIIEPWFFSNDSESGASLNNPTHIKQSYKLLGIKGVKV